MGFIVLPLTHTIVIVFQWVLLAVFILFYMIVQTWCQMIHSSVRIALSMESLYLQRMKVWQLSYQQPPVVYRSCCFVFLLVCVCVCLCVCVSQQLWQWVGLVDVMGSPWPVSMKPTVTIQTASLSITCSSCSSMCYFRYCLYKHESPPVMDSRRAES